MATGAQSLIKELINQGVDVVFGYPGGAILPVYKELANSPIRHILTRTEQGAAHAAAGYARISGKAGVCIATSGPGATNLVTGLANAFLDSVPIVAFTGQVSTGLVGTDAFQEVDITGITQPITKHNYLVTRAEDLPRVIREAFYIASTGRPGPVLIDIPKNVADAESGANPDREINLPGYAFPLKPADYAVKEAAEAISAASRPLFYVGGGVAASGAGAALLRLAERIDAPIVCSLMGLGAFSQKHPLLLGMVGLHGLPAANMAVSNCDMLVAVGARFGDRVTGPIGGFAPYARVVHIDVDPAEISKNVLAAIPVMGDAGAALEAISGKIADTRHPEWRKQVAGYQELNAAAIPDSELLSGRDIICALNKTRPEKAIMVTDVGQHQMTVAQAYEINRVGGFLTSGGLGTMGYALPAALGAQLASPDDMVFCVCGDGGFQMSMNELATISAQRLPVKIFIFNNGSLGMVRQLQHFYCDRQYFAVDLKGNPDFIKIAEAYNMAAYRIGQKDQIESVLREVVSNGRPTVIECLINPDELIYPMILAGKPICEMELP